MSTFLQLVNQAKLEIGVEGAALSTVDSQVGMPEKLVSWVAEADYTIQGLFSDWNFLWSSFSYSTVVGSKDITKPIDLGEWDTESFWLDYSTSVPSKLANRTYVYYRDVLRPGVATQSDPTSVIVAPDGDIILYPTPATVQSLTANYWVRPTKLVDGADQTVIPPQYERIIVVKAKMYFAEEQEVPTLYNAALAEYQDLLLHLKAHELPGQKRKLRAESPEFAVRAV